MKKSPFSLFLLLSFLWGCNRNKTQKSGEVTSGDYVGFGIESTLGGGINTPTLSKVFKEGKAYNEFHTAAICSSGRTSWLIQRNHTRVYNGTIAESAEYWDGFLNSMVNSPGYKSI